MQEQGCTLFLLFSFPRQHAEQGTTLLLPLVETQNLASLRSPKMPYTRLFLLYPQISSCPASILSNNCLSHKLEGEAVSEYKRRRK